MEHREVTLRRAVEGFLLHKAAEHRSPRTLADYQVCRGKLLAYAGDIGVRELGVEGLRRFFAFLSTECEVTPGGCTPRPAQRLSAKTIRNIHAALSSFFTWAMTEGFCADNPMARLRSPKNYPPQIEPLTESEVVALLRAVAESQEWRNRPGTRHKRPTAVRDRAMLLLLLDTGIRASELCSLKVGDLDQKTGHVTVRNGKGGKSRIVRAEKATLRAIWLYLVTRPADLPSDAPLFALARGADEQPINRNMLLQMLNRAGERSGLRRVHPHRFRHTLAIEYLRNGGDIYTLQAILGHSSLDMVRRYLAIVQADVDAQRSNASPVKNWRL